MIDTSKNMLYYLGNLNTENERVSYQMATKEILKEGSDDALLHSNLIDIDDKLRVTQGLMSIITKSKIMNTTSDSSLEELKRLMGTGENTIQQDLLKGLNAGMDSSDKLALATNLRGIRSNMIDLVNAKVDGEYVFTGSETNKQTLVIDTTTFDLNGKVEYGGDGFLREVAVQPGSYRDRGVTAYDVSFYTASKAFAGETFEFEDGERIIDENGFEWKLNPVTPPALPTQLQKYDYDGNVYHPLNTTGGDITAINIAIIPPGAVEATATTQAVKARYTTTAVLPSIPSGRVFEAKHNYFDDLNVIINALEGQLTSLSGERFGPVPNDELVRSTLSQGLEKTKNAFDAVNVGHGELGGRNNVFNNAYNQLVTQETHYNILSIQTGGADIAKLSLESKALELTYQSLYTTISKMNKLSLLNYIN